ncbi:MAG: KamA family radical SAM protein [Chloroflexi bacterium]|nr:KamA family radical SAM protein [Chloroflexota bacterium]
MPIEFAETEEEPPSSSASAKTRFFADVDAKDWCDWKWQFRNRISKVEELDKYFHFSAEELSRIKLVALKYPLSVTPYYLSLIDLNNPQDPIGKQAIPSFEEVMLGSVGYEDPLEEQRESVVPGLVHRYPDRVLMVLTDICAVLCRHCTRKREWKNGGWVRDDAQIEAMMQYIRRHTEVRDVIISGGDPLTLSTRRLESVLAALRSIEHVEIIRIGTRFPVVLPYRIDDELCQMLSRYSPIWLNTHFNHPNEVTDEAAKACDRLLRAGVPVNNQSVLLKGVNDSVGTMTKLCHRLLRAKVRPYYLFQCDEVQGTEHLRTPVDVGIGIVEGMRGHTSGLAVPTFVVDLPHGGGKVSLQPNYVVSRNDGEIVFRNYERRLVRYRNPGTPRVSANRRSGKVAVPVLAGASFESLDPAAWRSS